MVSESSVLRLVAHIDHYLSYTKAIEVSIRKDAVFYSNRAACKSLKEMARTETETGRPGYTNYSPPNYELCVADCDSALELDHT